MLFLSKVTIPLYRKMILVCAGVLFCFLFLGCAPNSTLSPDIPLQKATVLGVPDLPTEQYIIQVGDELDIVFYSEPRLNQLMYVRPDGCISLQLVGEVRADGLSVPELKALLEEKYSEELSDARLNVNIKSFASYLVFIGGDVKSPSAIKYDGKITVLQAISMTGGYWPKTAIINDVLVIRREPGKPPRAYSVDLTKILDGSDLNQDFYLYQYDTVYVKTKARD